VSFEFCHRKETLRPSEDRKEGKEGKKQLCLDLYYMLHFARRFSLKKSFFCWPEKTTPIGKWQFFSVLRMESRASCMLIMCALPALQMTCCPWIPMSLDSFDWKSYPCCFAFPKKHLHQICFIAMLLNYTEGPLKNRFLVWKQTMGLSDVFLIQGSTWNLFLRLALEESLSL
jgi:hypothetical protein